ncbi:hypothetical protein QUF64_15065 [Anaerolineales bacterium HSG6]|nr:hypothetical protein [Anaerolineales bacterium HSG6]
MNDENHSALQKPEKPEITNDKFLWLISNGVSILFLVLLALMWYRINTIYQPREGQLTDDAKVTKELDRYNLDSTTRIPTGVFINTFRFKGASEVALTGIVWQTYLVGEHDHIKRGYIFPEEVDALVETTVAYSKTINNKQTIGWYFDATLNQPFNYSKYPLDHKVVWLRMWHKDGWGSDNDNDNSVVLVPDLSSYDSTGLHDTFGLDKDKTNYALGGWTINETFFDYKSIQYGTTWGIRYPADLDTQGFPDLRFNIVIKRKYFNAAVTNFMPLLIVAVMLFASLMLVTQDKKRADAYGFTISNTISTAAGLLFVLIVSHVQLRQEFPGADIVYIEYFYILMYFIILGIIFNTYMFGQGRLRRYNRDNIIPKLVYWPLIFGTAIIITLVMFQDTLLT